jgi:hypothetical protein
MVVERPGAEPLARDVRIVDRRRDVHIDRRWGTLGKWLTSGVTVVTAADMTELQTALSRACAAMGLTPPTYSTTPAAGTNIYAADITELRAAVIVAESSR